MWDRLTPRLRRLIAAALEEAGKRGCAAAGTEHLLLAIMADPQSGGAIVLERCGIHIAESDAQKGDNTTNSRADSLDDSALKTLTVAAGEAIRLNHGHTGSEHVVLAMAKRDELELKFDRVDAEIRRWFVQGNPRPGQWRRWPIVLRPIQKLLRAGEIGWKIYGRKSLGHPGYVRNPYPLYNWLRRHEPVRIDPLAPIWILTRYDDVAAFLRDPRFRKDPFGSDRIPRIVREQLGTGAEFMDAEAISMLFLDPPKHTRVRSVFARAFTPATLASLRPRIELICQKRLDRVESSGEMDLIADLAYPLPVLVIAELLGFPAEDYEKFKYWSDELTAGLALNATEANRKRSVVAREQLREYFDQMADSVRRDRPDSLVARLLEMEERGDGLDRDENFINSILLLAAGHETTTNLIGNGVLALMQNREQWELLVNDPALVDSCVEEFLRFDSPVQWTSRAAGEPIEIAGKTISTGQIVLGCVGAANRDPTKFADPDRFDIRRPDNKHLAFGTGIHFCIGAALARMEAQIALAALVRRFPKMRRASRKLHWMKGLTFRGVTQLSMQLR
jgi:pimeloyl-[acyl-carrier protein] synthase